MNNNATNVVNIPDIQARMYQKIVEYGWADALKFFMNSDDYANILRTLAQEVADGKRFTPRIADTFNAFKYCSMDNLKVVLIGQDPYPQLGVADGLAFSCSIKLKREASLNYMLKALDKTVYPDRVFTDDEELARLDLRTWAEQGVLLLNSALTTQIGKPGTHQDLWKPFLASLLDNLSHNKPGLIYILLGKKAQEWEDLIDADATILKASHPAAAAYSKLSEWDCCDVFNKTNEILGKKELPKIIW